MQEQSHNLQLNVSTFAALPFDTNSDETSIIYMYL